MLRIVSGAVCTRECVVLDWRRPKSAKSAIICSCTQWQILFALTAVLLLNGDLSAEPPREPKTVRLTEVQFFDKGGSVYAVDIANDGKHAIIGGDLTDPGMLLWDLAAQKLIRRIEQPGINAVISPDAKWIAYTGPSPNVTIIGTEDGTQRQQLFHGSLFSSLAVVPDGTRLLSAGLDGSIAIWKVETGEELLRIRGHQSGITGLAVIPDGDEALTIVTGSVDKTWRVWDSDGQELRKVEHNGRIWSLTCSPDGKLAATGTGGVPQGSVTQQDVLPLPENPIRLWSVSTGELVRELAGHDHVVRALAFSPDGSLLASGGYDRSLRLWDVATGDELARIDGDGWVTALKFTPDGEFLLSVGGVRKDELTWVPAPAERFRLFKVERTEASNTADDN